MEKELKFPTKQLEVLENIPFTTAPFGKGPSAITRNASSPLKSLENKGLVHQVNSWGDKGWKATRLGNSVILQLFPMRKEEYYTELLTRTERRLVDLKKELKSAENAMQVVKEECNETRNLVCKLKDKLVQKD